MSPLLQAMLLVSAAVLGACALAGTWSVLRGPDDPTRVVVADLLYFCALALFVILVLFTGSAVALDVLTIGSLIGIVSTVALARMITRGER